MKTHMKFLSWLALLFPLGVFALVDGMEPDLGHRDIYMTDGQATYAKRDIRTNCPVESMDWDTAEIVRVTLKDYEFNPKDLTFKACQPYVLKIANMGDKTHNFFSKSFFATVGVPRPNGEVSLMTRNDSDRLVVKEGQETDFAFVALEPGNYELKCTRWFHASRGMRGTILVE